MEIRESEKSMACDVWRIFFIGRYQWLASIIIVSMVLCICHEGICLDPNPWQADFSASRLLNQLEVGDKNSVQIEFDEFANSFDQLGNSIYETRKFLSKFIDEINSRYRTSFVISDVFQIARENLALMQLPIEAQDSFLIALEQLDRLAYPSVLESNNVHLYWPWEWNWFGLNKDKKKRDSSALRRNNTVSMEREIPGSCIIGTAEAIAGMLVLLLPIPGSQLIGWGMLGDGGRRIIDGVVQLSEERRNNPNYIPPTPPF